MQLQSPFSADHSSSHLPCGFPRQQLSRAGSRDLGKNPTTSCICWKGAWACPAKSSCLFMLWVVATVILGGGCVQHIQPGQSLEVQPWSGDGGFAALRAGKAVSVFARAAGIHPHPIPPINPLSGCSLAGAQPAPLYPTEAMLLNHSKGIRTGEWKNASKLGESLEDRADLLRQHMGCTGVPSQLQGSLMATEPHSLHLHIFWS